MTACAWCLRFTSGKADTCQFPGSDVCRSERIAEDMAHAINAGLRERSTPQRTEPA